MLIPNSARTAEFLVYAKTHWMESVDRSGWNKAQLDEYATRYVKGDVVEVREDGYWTVSRGYDKAAFAVIAVPGVLMKNYKHYEEELVTGVNETEVLKKRRKYRLKIEDFSAYQKDRMSVGEYVSFNAIGDIPIEIKVIE